jgi:anaerobic selenocysteine-containing dehydrogenase
MKSTQSRREFVKKTSLIAGSLATLPFVTKAQPVNTSVDDAIKVALVGCGGREARECKVDDRGARIL